MTEQLVRFKNNFIEAQYNFSLLEKKLMTGICNQMQQLHVVDERRFENIYSFSAQDIAELVGVNEKDPKHIRAAIKNMMKKIITCEDTVTGDSLDFPLFTIARYKQNGIIEIGLRKEMVQFILFKLEEGNWTPYHLENIRPLRSVYSIRIYELLKAHEKQEMPIWKCPLDEFKKLLGIPENEYDRYANLKARVIEQAKKDLKEKTDISFSYREEKLGRVVVALIFKIKSQHENSQKQSTIFDVAASDPAAPIEAQKVEVIDDRRRQEHPTKGSTAILTRYSRYVVLCAEHGEEPVPFDLWKKENAR